MKFLIFLLFLLSCTSISPEEQDKELFELGLIYEKMLKSKDIHLTPKPMFFADLEALYPKTTYLGVCYFSYTIAKYNYIVMNRKRWHTLSRNQKLFLVMHEQGHCLFGLKHTEVYNQDGSYSLMAPMMLPGISGRSIDNYWKDIKNTLPNYK